MEKETYTYRLISCYILLRGVCVRVPGGDVKISVHFVSRGGCVCIQMKTALK